MSKVTVAFGSFVAGICSVLLFLMLSGSHTSIAAQEPAKAIGVLTDGAVPTVPPLGGIVFAREMISGVQQPLDGFNCEECSFTNVDFTYGGGATRIVNPKFSGTIRINFNGAAANTLATVAFLQAMLQNQKPPVVNPNAPMIRTATTKAIFVADLVTPYGQK